MTDGDLRRWLEAFAQRVQGDEAHLTELDAAIGDADHGSNLRRGLEKAVTALEETVSGDLQATAKKIGMTLMSTVGGASGALWGTFWLRVAQHLPASSEVEPDILLNALEAGVAGIRERGKAEPGDKTMLDVWLVAVRTLQKTLHEGRSLDEALGYAARAALEEAERTVPLMARRGRASYLGERSRGHMDPGSLSTAYFWAAFAERPDRS